MSTTPILSPEVDAALHERRSKTSFNHPVQARGKFLFSGEDKFFVKGVSYGAFAPNEKKEEYFDRSKLRDDFALMAAAGFNTVRIPHTAPPPHLLDIAQEQGLRVMIGLSAEQYIGYLIDKDKAPDLPKLIRERAAPCAGHPALLCYGLGNEIPSSLARWVGRRKIESFLKELYYTVKNQDPDGIVTYVNYPTTEYLHLPFLDALCFNVYLEQQERYEAYLARLQSLAGERPLIMSEIGLDAYRNGVEKQAEALQWQIRSAFSEGCSGVVVFSWTDEWFRGGAEVDDWEFGLTTRDRTPKSSLHAVSQAFAEAPFPVDRETPKISVVLCTYNGSATLEESLIHLGKLKYPDYEVIVVNDGSTDRCGEIARKYPVRLIETENHGLSSARNTGWQAATGEIVAYIDDDAYPDEHWLDYLALTFTKTGFAAVGGPNLSPIEDGWKAQCIARAPGGPTHVLLSDRTAEHIPGCNMAFKRDLLEKLGGFDHQFRVAGDDVDICWRVLDLGEKIGFSPAALVWHHRRPSIAKFWKQQKFYGRAEALLHRKWPQKFNQVNHTMWHGRVYRAGINTPPGFRSVIYHGLWGEAPYQSLHPVPEAHWEFLPLMPEWYLVNVALLLLVVLGAFWKPLLWAAPVLVASILWPLIHVLKVVQHVHFDSRTTSGVRFKLTATIVWLNMMQPLARLWGRVLHGLAPWTQRNRTDFHWPRRYSTASFETEWIEPRKRLELTEQRLMETRGLVARGGDFEDWDLELYTGIWGGSRLLMAVEDQGSGTQYVRFGVWPRFSKTAMAVATGLMACSVLTAWQGETGASVTLAVSGTLLFGKVIFDAGSALAGTLAAIRSRNSK